MSAVGRDRSEELAIVVRGELEESVHFGHACLVTEDGELLAEVGASDTVVVARSTLKPAQVAATLRCGAQLSEMEIAIAAGSHTGERRHQGLVRRLLERHGLSPHDLACPADWPEDEEFRHQTVAKGDGKSSLAMNCSGKHAAMLAASQQRGWSLTDYLDPAHPVQRAIVETLADLAGEEISAVTVDGCGAPAPALSLRGLGSMAAKLGKRSEVGAAMRRHPWAVGGTGHLNTQ